MSSRLNASLAKLRQSYGQSTCLQQKIQKLQEERRKLDLEFEEQLLQHAQADCKQLVEMMHTKLPQELKELIYQYLYIEDAPIPVGSYHFTTYIPEPLRSEHNPPVQSEPFIVIPEGAVRQDHSVERDENIIYPDNWLLNPAFLGYTVAKDASRYYYKANSFSVCTLENVLLDFLFQDPIQNFLGEQTGQEEVQPLNLLPINHIRNLQIRVKYEHYTTYLTFYDNLRDGEKNLIGNIFGTLRNLASRIRPAAASQLKVEFCMMTTYKSTGFKEERAHINLLEAVRVPVYMFKYDLHADITVTHYDEYISPFPKNITGLFKLSENQWQYEKDTDQAALIKYSPLYFYISARAVSDVEGFGPEHLYRISQNRWGLASPFAPSCTMPVEKGPYWPVGRTGF